MKEEDLKATVWLFENIYLPRFKDSKIAWHQLMRDAGNFTCQWNKENMIWNE